MDGPISEDQQDVVDVLVSRCGRILVKSVDDGSKHGRPCQANTRQLLLVRLKDPLGAHDAGLLWVAIQGETVHYLLLAVRNCAETERGEHFIEVVRLQNCADLANGCSVLVLGAHEVKRSLIPRISVRSCEVDSDG